MKPLREVTVLITAAGNVFMPGTTACLTKNGERKIRLIGADMNDDKTMLEMVDAYYPVPRGDDPAYIDVLLDICKKEKVEVILPIMSVELNALAENRERFEAIGTKVGVSDIEPLNIANDKLKLFDYMSSAGISCAAYQAVHILKRECASKQPTEAVAVDSEYWMNANQNLMPLCTRSHHLVSQPWRKFREFLKKHLSSPKCLLWSIYREKSTQLICWRIMEIFFTIVAEKA